MFMWISHLKALRRGLVAASIVGLTFASVGLAQDRVPTQPTTRRARRATTRPSTRPSESAELAPTTQPIPGKLYLTTWAPRGFLKNPVALSFDRNGRAYVAETQRREGGEFQTRTDPANRVLPDHTFQSVADRVLWAGDGDPSWGEQIGGKKETIHILEDSKGTGKADKATIYYEGFNRNQCDILAGVLWNEGNVYATIAPNLWLLQDPNHDGHATQVRSLSFGYGVHMSYSGHNMHGLCVGPDGKIYFSIGDKALNVTTAEGKHLMYPYCGSILRCNPDGSDLEEFAYGLRNLQEFAFDRYGNLIGVDNDGDYPGERERLVYVTQDSDSGWRYNWQYRSKNFDILVPLAERKTHYNPWLQEKLWVPYFATQAAYITPPLANYTDGPCGLKYATEGSLNEKYRGYFFVTEFPKATIRAFKVQPKGAEFAMVDDQVVSKGTQCTGLALGPDGAIYGCEWGHTGFKLGNVGSVVKLDDSFAAKTPLRTQTHELLREGPYKLSTQNLLAELNNVDMRVRLDAQFELVRRGALDLLKQVAFDARQPQMARIHALWGIGQFASNKTMDKAGAVAAGNKLLAQCADPDPEIRTQTVKLLSDLAHTYGQFVGDEPVIKLLEDSSPRVRFFAAAALGQFKDPAAIAPLIHMAAENRPVDPYIRQAAILGLTGIGNVDALLALANHPLPSVRQVAVVALRRLKNPGVAVFLRDRDEWVATEAARAIHDDYSIPAALPALARAADREDINNPAFMRRALNANLRVGGADQVDRLVRFAGDEHRPTDLRVEAIDILASWEHPTPFDRVEGWYRVWPQRSGIAVHSAIEPLVASLLASPSSQIADATTHLIDTLGIKTNDAIFARWVRDTEKPVGSRVSAMELLAKRKYRDLSKLVDASLSDDSPAIRAEALRILSRLDSDRAMTKIKQVLDDGTLRERQSALRLLATIKDSDGQTMLAQWMDRLLDGQVPADLQLDLLESAQAANGEDLNKKLDTYEHSISKSDPLAPYAPCLAGGDAENGKTIFMTHAEAACVRCHSVDGSGSTVGPNLAGIGANPEKSKRYILESMIDPNAYVVPGYGAAGIKLKDGTELSGIVKSEDDTTVHLMDLDGVASKVRKADIVSRTPPVSVMPAMGAILSKSEIRDVIAYVTSLKQGGAQSRP